MAAAVLLYGIRLGGGASDYGKIHGQQGHHYRCAERLFHYLPSEDVERRDRLKQAEESLNGLFNNRRINASAAPAVIGWLPVKCGGEYPDD